MLDSVVDTPPEVVTTVLVVGFEVVPIGKVVVELPPKLTDAEMHKLKQRVSPWAHELQAGRVV